MLFMCRDRPSGRVYFTRRSRDETTAFGDRRC